MINHHTASLNWSESAPLVAIGSSTGGPRALQQVLTDVSVAADFQTPIFIVQHMPTGFTKLLANRLNSFSAHQVKEAEHGEVIKQRTIYIAPANFHMEIVKKWTSLKIALSQTEPKKGHRPSVDVMLESLAKIHSPMVSVILTGMGNDGTQGVKILKEKNPSVQLIAESEETSIVFGMPKSAINTNLTDHILPLHSIGTKIIELITDMGGN